MNYCVAASGNTSLVEDVELLLEHGPEDVVGGALRHEVLDGHAVRLPDAVGPVNGFRLILLSKMQYYHK